jgi:hypothetical protein
MRCDTCGNDYERSFRVVSPLGEFTFDSFECAIQKLAPLCGHCGCRIIGHGVDRNDGIDYCCTHCMRMGQKEMQRAADAASQ